MNDEYITLKSKLSSNDKQRIKQLRIPPNWTSVKISKDPTSKVQATGIDAKDRMQYIYHPVWVLFSKDSKYSKVNSLNFKKVTSVLNKYKTQNTPSYNKNFVIANMLILMKDLNIRAGNEKYLKENNSVGLCTLNKTHYHNKNGAVLKFIGKKGVLHEKTLRSNHIQFIEMMLKLPGKLLFQYKSENKSEKIFKKITPEDLNNFLKEHVDENMSTKDIRTYQANEIFKTEYAKLLKAGNTTKKARIEATKKTALELGNTPFVCRKSYIDPALYEE